MTDTDERPKAAREIMGYKTELPSGAIVWMARLDNEKFALKFTNAEGEITRLTLSPEAMQAVMALYAGLIQENAYVENGSYVRPERWEAALNYVVNAMANHTS